MAPFYHDVCQTQNLIKIENDENKTVPKPDSNLKTPPHPICITTIKKEIEVVEILSSDEENIKEDNPKHADSQAPDSKPADSNGASKKMFPLFAKGYKPPKPVEETESDDGDVLIPVLELYCSSNISTGSVL